MASAPQPSYLQALADKYYQQLGQRNGASGGNSLASLRGVSTGFEPTDPNSFMGRVEGAVGPQSTLGHIIDVASRPLFAVANTVKEVAADPLADIISGTRNSGMARAIDSGANPLNSLFNATAGAFNSGLSGRSKTLMSDATLSRWEPKSAPEGIGKFIAGLSLDIGTDPLTYVPGAAVASVGKKIPGVMRSIQALQKSGTLEKPAIELPKALEEITGLAPASERTAEQAPNTLSSIFKLFEQKSVTQAAKPSTTVDGKAVYSIKNPGRLPNLYAKPAAPAATVAPAAKSQSILDWVTENVKNRVSNSSDTGEFIFAPKGEQTIGEVFQEAQNLRKTGQTPVADGLMRDLQRLFEQSTGVSQTGTRKATPNAADLAQEAARGAGGPSRLARVQGAQRAKILSTLKDRLNTEDYMYLVSARSDATFRARRAEILSRVHAPILSTPVIEGLDQGSEFAKKMLGEFITPSEIKPGTVLNASDPVVEAAIRKATERQFKAAEQGFKYRSKVKDTARTNVKQGKGLGISDRGFNKYAQYGVWQDIISSASKKLAALGKDAPHASKRAELLRVQVLKQLDEADAVLRSRGIEPILGNGHQGIALSIGDILHALDANDAGRSALLRLVFNRKTGAIAPTNLADAAELLLFSLREAGVTTTKELDDFLRTVRATKGETDGIAARLSHELVKDPGGNYSATAEAIKRRAAGNQPIINKGFTRSATIPAKIRMVNGKPTRVAPPAAKSVTLGGKELTDATRKLVDALINPSTVRKLMERNLANSARYNGQLAHEVQQISKPVIEEFFATWQRPTTSAGEAIMAYSRAEKAVDAAATAIDSTDVARKVSRDLVISDINDAIAGDLPALERLQAIVKATTNGERIKTGQALHDTLADEVIEAVSLNVDIAELGAQVTSHSILRAMFPFLENNPTSLAGRFGAASDFGLERFIPQAAHATIRPALSENTSVVRSIANAWRDALTQVHRAFPEPRSLAPIFARIQQGEKITGELNPAQIKAVDTLNRLVAKLFEGNSTRGTNAATDIFFRNAAHVDHVNGKLAASGLPEHMHYDIAAAVAESAEKNITLPAALSSQWRSWKIDDPVDFMAKMQHAATSTHVDQAIARDAYRIARSKNLVSDVRRAGFIQISDSAGKSVLARYLPEGAWWHRDIVDEIVAMDRVLSQSLSFTSASGIWINKYLDPFLNAWKAGMTIYRPGHHVRNLVGDSSLAFLADGVGKPHQIKNALYVMGMKGNYDDFSALRALQQGNTKLGAGAKVNEAMLARGEYAVASVTLRGGKKISLTAKQVNDYVRSHGMLPDFVSGEDLLNLDKQSQTIRAIQEALSLSGGKVRKAAGFVSESRDDFVRLTHFLQVVEKNSGKFSSVDELMDFAVRRVRKWHPDGTDLTPFESKVMRRVFPFYSWTKKTMPLVVESMVMHPGRVMAWPKAMYNIAEAAGIDPASISDPFPQDQLFPSFLTDEMTGPVADVGGDYYGIAPGIASSDIMNQFIGDPKAGILGMLTPFIKAPAELVTGTRIDTGSKIQDSSEYVASNIPGLSHVNSLSGVDWLGSLLEGQGIKPLASVDKGNREAIDVPTLVNFLTGLGISNQSKPSYINYAEIEKRNAAARNG